MNALAASMVSRLLSRYVEGITKEMLDVNVFSGNLVLTDAKIKKAALEGLDLPFDVHRGVIGKLTLRVPWAHIKTRRAELLIESIQLLATPRDPRSRTWSAEEEARRKQERKQERLQTFEEMRASKEGRSGGAGWSAKILELVVTNLRVVVQDVHVRFEDFTNPESPYALGVMWAGMTLGPTTENWEPTFLTELGSTIFKVAKLQKFSVYAHGGRQHLRRPASELTHEEWLKFMSDAYACGLEAGRCVGPLDLELKICQLTYLGLEDEAELHAPLVESMAHVSQVQVALRKSQYDSLLRLTQQVTNFAVVWEYALLRPVSSVSEDAKAWWRFAKTCVVRAIRRTRIDQDMMKDGKRRIKADYIFLWKIFVKARRKKAAIDPKWARLLTMYEVVLPELDLISYRVIAYRELDAEKKRQKAAEAESGSSSRGTRWLRRMTGKSASADGSFAMLPSQFLPAVLRNADAKAEKKAVPRRKTYSLEVADCMLLLLEDGNDAPVSTLECKGLSFSITDTKVDNTLLMKLRHLAVHDTATREALWGQVLGPEGNSSASALSLVYSFAKPVSRLDDDNRSLAADTAITLQTSKPMRLVLNDSYLRILTTFFRPPSGWRLLQSGLGIKPSRSSCTPSNGRSMMTAAAVSDALDDLMTAQINIVAASPTIVIPHDCSASETETLLLNLGQLRLTSRLHLAEKAQAKERALANRLEDTDTHEWWDVNIKGMRISVRPSKDGVLLPSTRGTDVLSETAVQFQYGSSLVPRLSDFPRTLYKGKVGPEVRVKLNHASLSVVSELVSRMTSLLYESTVAQPDDAQSVQASPSVSPAGSPRASPTSEATLFSPLTNRPAASFDSLAALLEVTVPNFILELSLAPSGQGEQLPVCVVSMTELSSTCHVPQEGYSSMSGVADLLEVTASDEAQQVVLLSCTGSTKHPLFSYTTNSDEAILFSLHLGDVILEPMPGALRRTMSFVAPYTVGVPVVQEPLKSFPDASLPESDMLVSSSSVLSETDIAFDPAHRLLVNGTGDVVLSGPAAGVNVVLLDGTVMEFCIVISTGCRVIFRNITFHCKKRLRDYVLPGSGEFVLEDCVVHSEADNDRGEEKHAEMWKAYSCAVYFDKTEAFLPRNFEMEWASCKWVYAWDGRAVLSAFNCQGLQLKVPPVGETPSYEMLREPVSLVYKGKIRQVEKASFEGTSSLKTTSLDMSCTVEDLLELHNAIYDINTSIYPPEAPIAMHWKDTLSMEFAAPLRMSFAQKRGAEGSYRISTAAAVAPLDKILMAFNTEAKPGEAPQWDSKCEVMVSVEVPGLQDGVWHSLLQPCKAVLSLGEKPTGLPRGCGHWKSAEYSLSLLGDARFTINDDVVVACQQSLEGNTRHSPSRRASVHPQAQDPSPEECLEQARLAVDLPGWELLEDTQGIPNAVALAQHTGGVPYADLHYIEVTSQEEPGVAGVYARLPFVTYNGLPVWAVRLGRSTKRLLYFETQWRLLHQVEDKEPRLHHAAVHPTGVAESPLACCWQGTDLCLERGGISKRAESLALLALSAAGMDAALVRAAVAAGASHDDATLLCCCEGGASVSEWIGHEPAGVLAYRLRRFYEAHDTESLDKVEALVDHVAEGRAPQQKAISLCCEKFSIPVGLWSGDFPPALEEGHPPELDDDDSAAGDAVQLPKWQAVASLAALEESVMNFAPHPAGTEPRTVPLHLHPARGVAGPFLVRNLGASQIQLLVGSVEGVTLEPLMFAAKALPLGCALLLPESGSVCLRIDTNDPDVPYMAARRASEFEVSRATTRRQSTWNVHPVYTEWVRLPRLPAPGECLAVQCGSSHVLMRCTSDGPVKTLEFDAPLRFVNDLPIEVAVTLSTNGGLSGCSSVNVKRGDSAAVHTVPPEATLHFEVSATCPLTGECRTSGEVDAAHCPYLLRLCDGDDVLPVRATVSSEHSARQVRLHSNTWILNATAAEVGASFGGTDRALPAGQAVPYDFDGAPCIEGVPVTGPAVIPLRRGGEARALVTDSTPHTLVMVAPMCIFQNQMSRPCKVLFVDKAEHTVATRGSSLMQQAYTGQDVRVRVQSKMDVWDIETTFSLPPPDRTLVVRLGNLWVPVKQAHDQTTGALRVEFGGKPPPPPVVISNQSWWTAVLGTPPCEVAVLPFTMGQAYLTDAEQSHIDLRLVGTTTTARILFEDEVASGIEQGAVGCEAKIAIRQKGTKDISTLVSITDPDMLQRRLSEEPVMPALSYRCSAESLGLEATIQSLGSIFTATSCDLQGGISFSVDGGVQSASCRVGDITLDSLLAKALAVEYAGAVLPQGPALVHNLLPLCWRGSPVATMDVKDLPFSGVDWASPQGLQVLLQAAQTECPEEVSHLLEALLQGEQGGTPSLETLSARAMRELSQLQDGNSDAMMRAAQALVVSAAKRRYGVEIDIDSMTVKGVDSSSLADYLLSHALRSHMGPKGALLASAARHLKVVEIVKQLSTDPESATVVREALTDAVQSQSTEEVLQHVESAAAKLQQEELIATIREIQQTPFDPDAVLQGVQEYLGVELTAEGIADWQLQGMAQCGEAVGRAQALASGIGHFDPTALVGVAGGGDSDAVERAQALASRIGHFDPAALVGVAGGADGGGEGSGAVNVFARKLLSLLA